MKIRCIVLFILPLIQQTNLIIPEAMKIILSLRPLFNKINSNNKKKNQNYILELP